LPEGENPEIGSWYLCGFAPIVKLLMTLLSRIVFPSYSG